MILSAFDPVRRQIAKISLERLIADGRIHPARIEEVVEKVKKETDQAIREAGEQATFDLGVHNAHQEIVRLIGRLKYRTSYAQNILKHSREVAYLCGIMAAELGLNVKLARRAGLLHDIGKAMDHETEGPHALIGAEVARRYEESDEVVNAIAVAPRGGGAADDRGRARARPPTPSPRRARAPAARCSRPTSSAWRSSRRSPTPSAASRRPTPSRPGARSGSWSRRARSTTATRSCWRGTSRARSRSS